MSTLAPAVAGAFYPASPAALARDVESRLDRHDVATGAAPVRALVAPHAGYVYSGDVAASVFAPLRARRIERVIVIGPSHHFGFAGAVIPESDRCATPLGDVPLDRGAIESLAASGVRRTDHAFRPEHAVEVEVPFLQRALAPGWSIVPILVGSLGGPGYADRIADALRPLLGPGTLLVVSSDFTHYGPRFGYVPFHDRVQERLHDLDLGAVRLIEAGDAEGFEAYVERTSATICGRRAIDVLLRLLPEGSRPELAAYDTSGAITGDWAHSVSYAGLLVRSAGPVA